MKFDVEQLKAQVDAFCAVNRLSYRAMASRVGISEKSFHAIIRGDSTPRPSTIAKFESVINQSDEKEQCLDLCDINLESLLDEISKRGYEVTVKVKPQS